MSCPEVVFATAILVVLPAAFAPIHAKVFLTQDEALALAFGEASRAERKTAYLTPEQAGRVKELAGSEPTSNVVVHYEGQAATGGKITAWFDTHLVRTLPETVMVVVGADARVVRVDILSFDEPEDYLPKPRWLDQFVGKPLDEDLSTSGSIRAVTGATMSSRAITATVRRVLALHEILTAGKTVDGSPDKPGTGSSGKREEKPSPPARGEDRSGGAGSGMESDRARDGEPRGRELREGKVGGGGTRP